MLPPTVDARLIGVIEAEQSEDGKKERNDRLIAVAEESPTHEKIKSIDDLDGTLLKEIEHFFISYNQEKSEARSLNRSDASGRNGQNVSS